MSAARFVVGVGALALIVWGAHRHAPAPIAAPPAVNVLPSPAVVDPAPARAAPALTDEVPLPMPRPHRAVRRAPGRHAAPSPPPQPCNPFGCLFH